MIVDPSAILSTFVHDLRSPLSSIRTGIEILRLSLDNRSQAEKVISMLERQTMEMARLVDQLSHSNASIGSEEADASIETPQLTESSRRVLVVDDSRSAADILSMFFRMEGFDVCSAYLGADAIELARMERPDVVFLDLGLPDLSGYEVLARIRELPGGDDCYIVALTGRNEAGDRQNIIDAGFDLHVVKPPEPRVLREVLNRSALRSR